MTRDTNKFRSGQSLIWSARTSFHISIFAPSAKSALLMNRMICTVVGRSSPVSRAENKCPLMEARNDSCM